MKKNNPILKEFNKLRENYTSVNTIKYVEFLRQQPLESILENSNLLYTEPFRAIVYLKEVFETMDLSHELIIEQRQAIEGYLNNAIKNGYDNDVHITNLQECLNVLNEKSNLFLNGNEYLKLKLLESYFIEEFNKKYENIIESGIIKDEKDIDKIIMSIKHDPTLEDDYVNFVNSIKLMKFNVTAVNIPNILIKNTSLLLAIPTLSITLLSAIFSLPAIIVYNAAKNKINRGYAESYLMCIDNEINKITMYKKDASPDKIKLYDDYINSLNSAKIELNLYLENHPHKLKVTKENIGTMVGIDGFEGDEISCQRIRVKASLTNLMFDDVPIDSNAINKAMIEVNKYSVMTEGAIRDGARKVALGAEKVSRSIVHAARKAGTDAKHVGVVTARVPQHIDNFVSGVLDKIKEMDTNERRNRIIEGGFRVKIFKFIRNAIVVGSVALVSPAIAAISVLASIAIDRKLDYDVRKSLVHEMEDELEIVNEKINDASSKGDKQKKYQLMRIRSKLQADIQRIKYNLDDAAKG